MYKKRFNIFIMIPLLICVINSAFAYDDQVTHPKLTNEASKKSTMEQYLNENIGFKYGLETIFTLNNRTETILKWLEKGSTNEDTPNCRASNHFHNPLLMWDQSYMTDEPWYIDVACVAWEKYSNITWATGYLSPPPAGPKASFNTNPYFAPYNWDNARNNYYAALTSTTKVERGNYFVWTFTTLGHIMHLLEDVSVPAHVRNDFTSHLIFNGIKLSWPTKWVIQPFEHYVKMNPQLIAAATPSSSDFPSFANPRLTDFWDTNLYGGSNPSSLNNIGMAEFTNANYFSDSTIWNNGPSVEHTFSFPKVINSEHQICTGLAPDGSEYRRYISRLTNGACPPIQQADDVDHFATPSLLNDEFAIVNNDISALKLWLDDNVHKTYAEELLPRAVGYSAGLLNYFFRGGIDLVKSGTRYKIQNLSDEDMEGTTGSFQLFFDDANDNRTEIQLTFYDEFNNPITDPATILTIPAQSLSTFEIELNNPPANPFRYVLVFKGRLGNEGVAPYDTAFAVIGKVINNSVYLIVKPLDNATRQIIGTNYYSYNINLNAITEADLPFNLIDDGGYWNATSFDWTDNPDPESLKVPLSVGGPQYIAKYKDDVTNTVRFVPNVSYEKNAYQDFHEVVVEEGTGYVKKEYYYVIFEGTPLLSFGAYEENPGYMEYMEDPNSQGVYGVYVLRPLPATNPADRFFSWYNSQNFVGNFIEYDAARFYRLDHSADTQQIPVDPEAPFASVVATGRSGNSFEVDVPKIFDYVRPVAYWLSNSSVSYGSSGTATYTAQIGATITDSVSNDKCVTEDNNCGNIHNYGEPSSVKTIFDIPYNFNSYVRVHLNDGGQYFEEVFVNDQNVATSQVSTEKLETHYQILAVYKNYAMVRETNWVSWAETPLSYQYRMILAEDQTSLITPRIYEIAQNYTASYFIVINGNRYDISGQTTVTSKLLDTPHIADFNDNVTGLPEAYHLSFEYVEDITGFHPDRIFISDTFDGNYILIAFDEYSYNNGAGLVHTMKYEPDDIGTGKYFLFFDIPQSELQGASHEALPVGRKLLLFKSDGTLVDTLQDPIGLNYSIGSIGMLN